MGGLRAGAGPDGLEGERGLLPDAGGHVAGGASEILHDFKVVALADEEEGAQGFPGGFGAGGKFEERLAGRDGGAVGDQPALDAAGDGGADFEFLTGNCA